MRIFLDTAETDLIRSKFSTGLIDGVTTNPSLLERVEEILKKCIKKLRILV